jgi:hypothetical protein
MMTRNFPGIDSVWQVCKVSGRRFGASQVNVKPERGLPILELTQQHAVGIHSGGISVLLDGHEIQI